MTSVPGAGSRGRQTGRAFKAQQIVLTLAGAALFAGLVAWIGPAVLWRQVVALRWILVLLIASGAVKHGLRTLAWHAALVAEGVPIPISRLLRTRLAAQGTGHLSGLDLLVSEPMKPWLLRDLATVEATMPSTLVEAASYWVTSLLVTTVGTCVALNAMIDGHARWEIGLVSVATFGGVVLFVFARTPLVPILARWIARRMTIRPTWSALMAKAGEIEAQMRSFRLRHPAVLAGLLAFSLLVQVVMFAEVWLVLWAAGAAPDFSHVLMIEAASRVVKMMSFYMPGRVGADEAGAAGSFALLGLNPAAGVALALGRRIQALTWAVVGVVSLGRAGVPRKPPARTESEVAGAGCCLAAPRR